MSIQPSAHPGYISQVAPAAGASEADVVVCSAAPEAAPGGATGLEPLPQASARVLERSSRPWHVLIRVRCAAMTCAAAQADLGVAARQSCCGNVLDWPLPRAL